ncbi:relaxase/mobilization nuclease domain-containing protein [Microvirga sp. 0TCS3.31]
MPICKAIPPPLGPNGRVGSFAACQAYIEGEERDRPSHVIFRGVVSLETAALEMDAQADLSRAADPVVHWIISYARDEPATNEMIEADVRKMLASIKLGGHQYMAMVHDDTDNRHAHVVVNRVGPDGRASQMSWCKFHSERCMAEIAQGRGVAIVPGKHNRAMVEAQRARQEEGRPSGDARSPDIRSRLSERDRVRLEIRGGLPWYEVARPAIVAAANVAKSWQHFAAELARHGIVIKHMVRISTKDGRAFHGLAFAEGHNDDAPGCKASAVGPDFRYSVLASRWGDYPDHAEGMARAALTAKTGIPERGAVVRTPGQGRKAARQRRAKALGSTLALETSAPIPGSRKMTGNKLEWWTPGADPAAVVQTPAESATAIMRPDAGHRIIRLQSAWQAAEHILAALRAKSARSKRGRRQANLQRWDRAGSIALKPNARPNGEQRGGIMRAQAEADAAWKRFPDPDINDHSTLKRAYGVYRAKQRRASRATEDEAWQRIWSQEQAIRQHENGRLRRSEQVKRALIIDSLQPGHLRRLWLEGLKLRFRIRRNRLKVRQAERWAKTRSEWKKGRPRTEPLPYKAWLLERAATDLVAARQYSWIDSMDTRRDAAGAGVPRPEDSIREGLTGSAPGDTPASTPGAAKQFTLSEPARSGPENASDRREESASRPMRSIRTEREGRDYES